MGVLLLNPHDFWGKSHGSVSSLRGPSAGLPAEGPAVTPRSRSRDPEAVPYLEGLASSPCGSFDEGPDSGASSSPDSNTPDDTSNSSSVVSRGRGLRAKADHPSVPAPNFQRRAEPLPRRNWAKTSWAPQATQTTHLGGGGVSAGPAQEGWRSAYEQMEEGVSVDGELHVNHQLAHAAKNSQVTGHRGPGCGCVVQSKDEIGPEPRLGHISLSVWSSQGRGQKEENGWVGGGGAGGWPGLGAV